MAASSTGKQQQPAKAGGSGSARKYSQRYPRGVSVDFRTLSSATQVSYCGTFGIPVSAEAPQAELGGAIAQHFEGINVSEEEAIGGFLARLETGGNDDVAPPPPPSAIHSTGLNALTAAADQVLSDYVRDSTKFDGLALSAARRKWKRRKYSANQGDQVAAKVTRSEENGSWILAYVLRYYPESETYDVQDEDDTSKLIRLPWDHVMRLSTGSEGWLNKSQQVMAIFPETTSFYRAFISKQPVWTSGTAADESAGGVGNAHKPRVKEVILKFEDDENEEGKTPHRRVPSRYVIPLPQAYFYDVESDIDLNAP